MYKFFLTFIITCSFFTQSISTTVYSDISYSKENTESFLTKLFKFEPNSEFIKLNSFATFNQFTLDLNLSRTSSKFKEESTELSVRELYYEYSLSESIEFILGRKLFKQGSAYYKNPAGFLNPEKANNDAEDRLKKTVGLETIGFHYFFENSDLQIMYTPEIDYDLKELNSSKMFLSYYFLIGNADLSLSYFHKENAANKFGLFFAQTVNDYLEIHGEFAYKNKNENIFHHLVSGSEFQLFQENPYTFRKSEHAYEFLIGFNSTTSFGLNWISEWWYNSENLLNSEWSYLTEYTKWLDQFQGASESAIIGNKKWIANSLNQQKSYLFNRFAFSYIGVDYSFISLSNTHDLSSVFILQFAYQLKKVGFQLQSTWFTGKSTSDYGSLFSSQNISLNMSITL